MFSFITRWNFSDTLIISLKISHLLFWSQAQKWTKMTHWNQWLLDEFNVTWNIYIFCWRKPYTVDYTKHILFSVCLFLIKFWNLSICITFSTCCPPMLLWCFYEVERTYMVCGTNRGHHCTVSHPSDRFWLALSIQICNSTI